MMELLELGYPYLPASVTTLNLSRRVQEAKRLILAKTWLRETPGVATDSRD